MEQAGKTQPRFLDRAEKQSVPVSELIGFRVTEVADGRAVVIFRASEKHANPMGTLHGGILCDIADAAMGGAFASTLAEGETFTTVELKNQFFPTGAECRVEGGSEGHPQGEDGRIHGLRGSRRKRQAGRQGELLLHGARGNQGCREIVTTSPTAR